MSIFSYLSVFISIVLGLGVVHVLSGTARMFTSPSIRPYWVHLLWTLNVLQSLTFFWWFTFDWRLQDTWTFGLFLFVVAFAMLWYMLCAVLIPVDHPNNLDYREYYDSKHGLMFSVWALLTLVDVADSVLKGPENLAALGPFHFTFVAFSFLLLVTVALTKSKWVHIAAVLIWTVTNLPPFVNYDVFYSTP